MNSEIIKNSNYAENVETEQEIITSKKFSSLTLQSMKYDKILIPLLSGIYAKTYLPITRKTKAEALCEVLPNTLRAISVVSGEAALWLHFFKYELDTVDIVIQRHKKLSLPYDSVQIITHESKTIFAESYEFNNLNVASPERAIFDLAKWSKVEKANKIISKISTEIDYKILKNYIRSQASKPGTEKVKKIISTITQTEL